MSEHAKYGGSTIERTEFCPAWVEFCAPLPKDSSEWADEGTLLHAAMQRIYTENEDFNPREVIGSKYKDVVLTETLFAEKIFPAIEAVEDIFDKFDVRNFVCESRVVIADDIWGTADLLGVGRAIVDTPEDAASLKIGLALDYKFGSGVMVSAEENRQGLFYGVAALNTPETQGLFGYVDLLIVAIVQPNDRGLPDYTLWEVDGQKLPEARQRILEVCAAAEVPDAPFCPGDHCQFCPGRGLCPPTSGEISAMLRLDVTAPDVLEIIPSYEEIKRVAKNCEVLLSLVHTQLGEGVVIPGFKLVPKQARRSYTDEVAAELVAKKSRKLKREEVYAMKLLSPAQMEKLLKAKGMDFEKLFGSLVQKVASGTTLAGEDDPREANPGMGALQALLNRD